MTEKASKADDMKNVQEEPMSGIEGEQTLREELGYIIDPEFKKLIGRTDEEYVRLKEAIRSEGRFRDPFVVWEEERILLDGHGRDDIYDELQEELGDEFKIEPPRIVWKSFANRDEAKMWIFRNQDDRRNWNAFRRIVSALHFKPYFAEQAKANQHAGVSQNFGKGMYEHGSVDQSSTNFTYRNRLRCLDRHWGCGNCFSGNLCVQRANNFTPNGFSHDFDCLNYRVKDRLTLKQSTSILRRYR